MHCDVVSKVVDYMCTFGNKYLTTKTKTASVEKSKQLGLSLPETLKRGQWTNKTTFYNKPSVDKSMEILKGKQRCLGGSKHSVLYQQRFHGMKFLDFTRVRHA